MSQHIGIVACSAPGAALCYSVICSEAPRRLGPHAHPEVSLHAFSFAEHVRCLETNDWRGVGELLLWSAEKLAAIGAELLICPDNTAHEALDLAANRSPLPWLNVAEIVAGEAQRQGYARVGLLGTRYLLQGRVYADRLAAVGIELVLPGPAEGERLNAIIFEELAYGRTPPAALRDVMEIIELLRLRGGCEAVILGCTELPLLVSPEAELGLPPPAAPTAVGEDFAKQLPAALDSGASAFSFTFGIPPPAALDAVRARGMLVLGTATTVEEARALATADVDAVVAQGSEAGAHRGSFAVDFEAAMVGTMALVPQIVDAVECPVIAAGGIMDGRGLAAALALGAGAVQMGTAFLTCDEAGVPDAYKEAILGAAEHETRVTRAFSGRPARGIVNRFMREVDAASGAAILPYPFQNALTRPLRAAAAKGSLAECLSLWAGQGVRLARRQPAAALVARLREEAEQVIARLWSTPEVRFLETREQVR